MNDIAEDFKQIKISRLTLGLIMSVAITSGVVVWNAAQVAGRIGDLENTVQVIEQGNNTSDSAVLARLDALERQIAGINPVSTEEVEEDLIDISELVEDLERQIEEYSYQLGDLWWRTDILLDAVSSQPWGDEFLRQQFSPQPGW
jgi:transcriptional regulator with XRE-family HTH domain